VRVRSGEPTDAASSTDREDGYGRLGGMSTPSERIFAQLEDGDDTELRDVLPTRARNPMSMKPCLMSDGECTTGLTWGEGS